MASGRHLRFGRGAFSDDRDLPLRAKRTTRTSRYWADHRWWGDQGSTSQCVGFAWSHWLNAAPICQWLPPDGIYSLAKYLDEWRGEDYEGTSVRAGAKVLQKLGLIDWYKFTTDIDVLVRHVLEVGPVVLGINWYESMLEPDDHGILTVEGACEGGHAILVSGVNCKRGLLRLKNSWGQEWGVGGRCWLSCADAANLLSEEGEACAASERMLHTGK